MGDGLTRGVRLLGDGRVNAWFLMDSQKHESFLNSQLMN